MLRKTIIFFVAFSLKIGAQIPDSILYDWSEAGLSVKINANNRADILDYGAVPDGETLNDEAIQTAIESVAANSEIYFPAGTYKFSKPIRLKSGVVITGASPDSTVFVFDLTNPKHLIEFTGDLGAAKYLKRSAAKGDAFLVLEDAADIAKGDIVKTAEEDEDKITSDWARGSTGQVISVKSLKSDTIFLNSALRRNYSLEKEARIVKINPIENAGIKNVRIDRLDKTENQTSNIYFNRAYNCIVKCVESYKCNFAHVDIRNSLNIEVSGSYFTEGFEYGGGGEAYGAVCHSASSECLVENNIFKRLRHSMLLQSGANGNVFAFNYSIEPYWTQVSLPSNSAGDLVLHGNYPYANLFESNVVQNIVIDNSHGINGPRNTIFRNRAESYGIFMNVSPPSDSQTFVGNEITDDSPLKGLYLLTGKGHFEYGNNVKGEITPENTSNLEIESLYLNEVPKFYENESNFPPIGISNELDEFTIEAETRYTSGLLTECASENTSVKETATPPKITIAPNPTEESVYIYRVQKPTLIQIYAAEGRKVNTIKNASRVNINNLPAGIYYLKITVGNDIYLRRIIKR